MDSHLHSVPKEMNLEARTTNQQQNNIQQVIQKLDSFNKCIEDEILKIKQLNADLRDEQKQTKCETAQLLDYIYSEHKI